MSINEDKRSIDAEEQDKDYQEALKSMGGRVDGEDSEPEKEEKPKEEPKQPQDDSEDDDGDEPEDSEDDEDEDDAEGEDDKKGDEPDKPEEPKSKRFIPMPKYLDEKKNWKLKHEEQEKKIQELTELANRPKSEEKDADLAKWAEKVGIEPEDAEELIKIVQKKALPEDQFKSLHEAAKLAEVQQEHKLFDQEFESEAIPEIKKLFPDADESKLKKVRDFLFDASHKKETANQELGYIIYKNTDKINSLLSPEAKAEGVKATSTGEKNRIGQGHRKPMTAKDFVGAKDFSQLSDMESEEANKIFADFDEDTYKNYLEWVKQNDGGVEVMRNGRKIKLK